MYVPIVRLYCLVHKSALPMNKDPKLGIKNSLNNSETTDYVYTKKQILQSLHSIEKTQKTKYIYLNLH